MSLASIPPSYLLDQLVHPVWPEVMGSAQDSAHPETPVIKIVVTVQFSRKTAGDAAAEEVCFEEELTVPLICLRNGCGSRDLIKKGFDAKHSQHPQIWQCKQCKKRFCAHTRFISNTGPNCWSKTSCRPFLSSTST